MYKIRQGVQNKFNLKNKKIIPNVQAVEKSNKSSLLQCYMIVVFAGTIKIIVRNG